MKILFVPEWLQAALTAVGAPTQDYYNARALLNTLSPQDVAFYILINNHLDRYQVAGARNSLIPSRIIDSFERVDFNCQLDHPELAEVKRLVTDYTANETPIPLETEHRKLTCNLLDENGIYFTLMPLKEGESETEDPFVSLYDRVIRQLYAFLSFEELATKPVFQGYLACRKQAMAA